MNKYLLFYAYLFFLLTIVGCSRGTDNCPTERYTNLSFEVPYKKGDVVKYRDSLGNKLIFKLENSVTDYYHKTVNAGNPDCGSYIEYNQYNNNFFVEANNKVNLFIGNYANGDTISNLSETVHIVVDSLHYVFWTEDLKGNFGSQGINVTLNGKKYNNVFVQYGAFYHRQLGLLSFPTGGIRWYKE
jgi:hypothetical protein